MNKAKVNLRVSELDTLSDTIVRVYKDAVKDENGSLSKDANLSAMMSEVESLSAKLTTAIKADKATSTLDEADIARDEVVRNIADALSGYAAIPIAAKKTAAQNLLKIFGKYGKQMTSKNYAEESSLIESLLEDFSSAEAKTDIEALDGIADLVSSLRTAQDNFNKAGDSYTSAKTGRGESATAVKKSLLDVMNNRLVPYLTAVAVLPDYKDFAAKVASEIDKANAAVGARKK